MLKDAGQLNATREITPEGYLLVKVALTRVGVQQYLLSDMTGSDADQGSFEGVDYQYRFDGPMMINHLAVVPDGRCGESVAILDKKTQETDMEKGGAKMSNLQDTKESLWF